MDRRFRWLVAGVSLWTTGWVFVAEAGAQSRSAAGASGLGLAPQVQSSGGGASTAVVPMTGAAGIAGSGSSAWMDPLGLNYVYGPAIPMTPAQAGMFMLSAQQRMLGLGNGQISGTRPGPATGWVRPGAARQGRSSGPQAGAHPTESHTRNSNVPGGQAARFFNRGGLTAVRERPYYRRQMRYFPQNSQ